MALNIEHKVENTGKNPHGRLSAEEFNKMVDTINDIATTVEDLVNGSSGEIRRNLFIQNNLSSRNLSVSKGEPCLLKFIFVSQERYGINSTYEDTGERGLCVDTKRA